MATFSNKNNIRTLDDRIHWNIKIGQNKFLCEKINSSVGWKKYLGEQALIKKQIIQCKLRSS